MSELCIKCDISIPDTPGPTNGGVLSRKGKVNIPPIFYDPCTGHLGRLSTRYNDHLNYPNFVLPETEFKNLVRDALEQVAGNQGLNLERECAEPRDVVDIVLGELSSSEQQALMANYLTLLFNQDLTSVSFETIDFLYNSDPLPTVVDEFLCPVSGLINPCLDCFPFTKNVVPCEAIWFSDPIPGFNQQICQIEIQLKGTTLQCTLFDEAIDESETEGIFDMFTMDLKVEARLPVHMFSGIFGFENQQTNLAKLFTSGIEFAWTVFINGLTCGNLVERRSVFQDQFFSYIQDIDILIEQFGDNGGAVDIRRNFQLDIPGFVTSTTETTDNPDATKCN